MQVSLLSTQGGQLAIREDLVFVPDEVARNKLRHFHDTLEGLPLCVTSSAINLFPASGG
jgi:hypothetical protein